MGQQDGGGRSISESSSSSAETQSKSSTGRVSIRTIIIPRDEQLVALTIAWTEYVLPSNPCRALAASVRHASNCAAALRSAFGNTCNPREPGATAAVASTAGPADVARANPTRMAGAMGWIRFCFTMELSAGNHQMVKRVRLRTLFFPVNSVWSRLQEVFSTVFMGW